MQIVGMLAMIVFTVAIALILILAIPFLRKLVGLGGVAPTGLASTVANAAG